MEKEDWAAAFASIALKLYSWLCIVLPPVVAANIAHWSASVLTGKKVSMKARIALFTGSIVIAGMVHKLFDGWKNEWIFTSAACLSTKDILEFLYLEWGGWVKKYLRSKASEFVNNKKEKE